MTPIRAISTLHMYEHHPERGTLKECLRHADEPHPMDRERDFFIELLRVIRNICSWGIISDIGQKNTSNEFRFYRDNVGDIREGLISMMLESGKTKDSKREILLTNGMSIQIEFNSSANSITISNPKNEKESELFRDTGPCHLLSLIDGDIQYCANSGKYTHAYPQEVVKKCTADLHIMEGFQALATRKNNTIYDSFTSYGHLLRQNVNPQLASYHSTDDFDQLEV